MVIDNIVRESIKVIFYTVNYSFSDVVFETCIQSVYIVHQVAKAIPEEMLSQL